MSRRIGLSVLTLLAAVLVALGIFSGGGGVSQARVSDEAPAAPSDGFNSLPPGLRGVSMSTLVSMGLVHPVQASNLPAPAPNERAQPESVITWGAEHNTTGTCAGNETAASVHPTNPLYAIVSGNYSVDKSSDGGNTWASQCTPSWPSGYGDVVHSWLPVQGDGWVLGSSLNPQGGTAQMTSGRSTDYGQTWANLASNIAVTGRFNDRQYLWTDTNPASPFYGRVYVTFTLFDAPGNGTFNTTGTRYSTDGGTTWSDPFLQDRTVALDATNGNRQFGSIGFAPGGVVWYGWMEVRCCGVPTDYGDFNKYKVARSTDGGVTFPFSTTAAVDTTARSVIFNDDGPAGFRWSPQADIGVDPADGTIYMVWLSRRTDNNNTGTAVKFTRSTDSGATWSAPAFVYNDPNANDTQYMPWIEVSDDNAVHVTFTSSTNNATNPMAHFYVQSTDQGQTWSAPFQLSGATYNGASFHGDYQALALGGRTGATQSIIASWTDNRAGVKHYARIGTFASVGGATPTPTVPPTSTNTAVPPSATTTNTPPAATQTPIGQPTATACTITFSDVPPDNTFYPFIRCLACRGIVNGYPDGTFKPNNPVTRGQLSKIVSQSAGFTEPVSGQTFEDVAPGSTFYEYVERLASRQVMGGYQCGIDPLEPCVGPENRPYFRPNAGATRGQLTKIVSNAAGFNDTIPAGQYQFADVQPSTTFWVYVERLLLNRPGVMSGYPCGGPGEPCDGDNRPYFRPGNPLTRGQTSKIVANTFLPGCETPGR